MDSTSRLLRAPVAILVAAIALSLVACGGSDAKAAKKTAAPAGTALTLDAGPVQVAAAGAPGTLSDADRDAIVETLRHYVVAATLNPMHGKPIGNLAAVFTPQATTALAGPDRAAVLDEGLPKAVGIVKATSQPVPIVALSDGTGAINLVGTTLVLDAQAKAKGGPVHITRNGELVLQRDANTWKIASYRVLVSRTGAGLPRTDHELDGEDRTVIATMRRHPFVTATITLPLVVALALTGSFLLWLNGVRLPYASGAVWFEVTKTAGADYTPAPDKPVFILALGNDGRPGETSTRGDAIHLIGVNPTLRKATILDFPRDTGLQIPGHGLDKVNAAHVDGGAALQAQTLGNAVGVQVPYAIDTNFDGFIGMVNDMGGLQVNVPEAMHDGYSGANFAPGPQKLSGAQALSFARNRHQFPTGDLQRSQNQGYLILQALTQLRAANTGPVGTLSLLANLGRHAQLVGVGIDDLYTLGRLGLSIDPANVRNVLVPIASGSGTRLSLGAGAKELFADFADDAVLESH